MVIKKTKAPKLKVPMKPTCRTRKKHKNLVDKCEMPSYWTDKNRFKQ